MSSHVFIVAYGKDILGQAETRDDAMEYLVENYGENTISPDNYYPKCQGMMEEWKCGEKSARIIMMRHDPINVSEIIKGIEDEPKRIPKPMRPVVNKALTPTRTRLITGNKTPPIPASELPEGTVKRGNDGTNWINKRKGAGYKWVRYYEETHDGLERKRKAPKSRAREFKEGTVMKGEDGNDWMVKKIAGNRFRWVRCG